MPKTASRSTRYLAREPRAGRVASARSGEGARTSGATVALQRLLADPEQAGGIDAEGLGALQQLAGNRATNQLLGRTGAGARGPVGGARGPLGGQPVVQRTPPTTAEDIDSGVGVTSGITNLAGTGSTIGTSAALVPNPNGSSQQVGSAGNNVAIGGAGLVLGAWQLGRSGQQLHEARKGYSKAKQSGDEKLKRVRGRQVNSGAGNVATNSLGVVNSMSGVVTGGMGIAGGLTTATAAVSTAGNVAGVVGAGIATPIQLFTLVRTSRQANLQRQRWNRTEQVQKAMQSVQGDKVNPEDLIKSASTPKQKAELAKANAEQQKTDAQKNLVQANDDKKAAELHRDDLAAKIADVEARIVAARAALEATTQLRQQRAKATGRAMRLGGRLAEQKDALAQVEQEKKGLEDDLAKARDAVTEHDEAIKTHQGMIDQHTQDIADHEQTIATHTQAIDTQNAMKADTAKSGHLNDAGQADDKMPTLVEIADYAVRKNRRGFARRGIGAGAAAIGVVGGAIGIAAAAETLMGNSQVGADLGIAGAVIGGVAAAIGIGVGIWKAVSWAKKRKAQAQKMAITAPPDKKPTFWQTYNPFRKTVDQSTKRRHYARALFAYATKGTPEQREESAKILAALDPKGPWAKKDNTGKLAGLTASLVDAENDEVIEHLMAKMASGG